MERCRMNRFGADSMDVAHHHMHKLNIFHIERRQWKTSLNAKSFSSFHFPILSLDTEIVYARV